ncbi:BA75_01816T0 [Komagataella pastoris]|uniref:biotin synthase n=1 Tax=Komagataella pastoris TaxID=4922 RepID=A0A1B2J5P3_PICPA|nr:BA75_01816T0 [Komagataella pastoris]
MNRQSLMIGKRLFSKVRVVRKPSTLANELGSLYEHNQPIFEPPTPEKKMSALDYAFSLKSPVSTWTKEQLREIYNTPLMELVHRAQIYHRNFHNPSEVQICNLVNIKSGGCTEDCKYCSQSVNNDTNLKAEKLMTVDEVVEQAKIAKSNGATRVCLGAAYRTVSTRKRALERITTMVKEVNKLGLESCVTLGMIEEEHARKLKDAGLTAYNHNIDTSREHYPNIITTRTYDDRLKTIDNVQKAGISACTGGILGLGETVEDHIGFLYTLCTMKQHPESLPINRLVPIKGTPIADELARDNSKKLKFESMLRTIATARMVMPTSIIRLAAGRYTMKETEQFLCFMAGCNAIFSGKKMLTTMCNGFDEDKELLAKWGMKPMQSFAGKRPSSVVETCHI